MKRYLGFSLLEVLIALGVLVGLGLLAFPAYKNYVNRLHYSELVTAIAPYQAAIDDCYQKTSSLKGCSAGKNGISANVTTPKDAVASITVVSGVITAFPVAHQEITATDSYVLTPKIVDKKIVWEGSGDAVKKGFVE